jgi:hypothetical protein
VFGTARGVDCRKCPWNAVLVEQAYTCGWKEASRASSLRASCLPECEPPKRERSESCPVKLEVDAWPPVLEYAPESRTSIFIGVSLARIRDIAPKPMS